MTTNNAWFVAIVLFLPPFLVPVYLAARSEAAHRLVAVQVASTLSALILAAMTFAFDQSAFVDVALALTLLSVPGTYLYTVFLERWL